MTARRKRKSRRLRAVSIQPQRDLFEQLVRELKRSKVVPEVVDQATVAFWIIARKDASK